MLRSFSNFSLTAASIVLLAACASTPNKATLMTGISAADSAKTFSAGKMRLATDPVCETFYENAKTFAAASKSPGSGSRFLSTMGLTVLSSVASVAIPTAGISSTAGRVAVNSAARSAVSQGSRSTVAGIKKASAPGTKIAKAAEELNCPINFTP